MIVNGYATLEQLRARLGKGVADPGADTELERLVEAASRHIDRLCGRRFYLDSGTSTRSFAPSGTDMMPVDDIGSVTGLVVALDTDYDGDTDQTLTSTEYTTWPHNALARGESISMLVHQSCWVVGRRAWPSVLVTARWGWPTVPHEIVEATLVAAVKFRAAGVSPAGVLGMTLADGLPTSNLSGDSGNFWKLIGGFRRSALA